MNALAHALVIRLEDGTAPITLIDAAVLSSLSVETVPSDFVAAFLLPSHHVWLAKQNYDQRHWDESIRFAKEALKGSQRLSAKGLIAACRYLCLAAARLGRTDLFDEGIAQVEKVAKDDWAKSNTAFLKGFNSRMKGNLPQAETFFRQAYAYSPGNLHASREIAAICLARGNLDEAELFAREAEKEVYDDGSIFTPDERLGAIRDIEIIQGFKAKV